MNESNGNNYDKSKYYSLHGTMYEMYIVLLFIVKSMKKDYKFRLASQWKQAEKFDDLALEIYDIETCKSNFRFLQAKHTQVNDKEISSVSLVGKNASQFDLNKYFLSYLNIKERFEKDEIKDLIIFTNIGMNNYLIDKYFTEDKESEDILHFQENQQGKILKFKLPLDGEDKFVSTITDCLNETYRRHALCTKLVKNLKNGTLLIWTNDELPYKSHLQKIIDLDTAKVEDEIVHVKFSERLFENKSLWNLFLEIYEEKPIEEINTYKVKNLLNKQHLRLSQEYYNELKNNNERGSTTSESKEITFFFEKLKFFINQPNQEILCDIVKKELNIGKLIEDISIDFVLNNMKGFIIEWMASKIGTFITTEIMNKFFNDVKQEFNSNMLLKSSDNFRETLRNFNLKFTDNSLKNLKIQEFLNTQIRGDILLVQTNQIKLTMIKIDQILINVSTIFLDSTNKRIPQSNSSHTVVIEMHQLTFDLKEIIANMVNQNKKIILVLHKTNVQEMLTAFNETVTCVNDCNNNFDDLTDDTKSMILDKNISFQGEMITLKEIMLNSCQNLIQDDYLWQIAVGEYKIGNSLLISDEIKNCYIERTFTETKIKEMFNSYDTYDKKIKEETMRNNFTVLSALPGMGKTTLFTHLMHKKKRRYPFYWIFKINLADHSQLLSTDIVDDNDNTTAINFLLLASDTRNNFDKTLFQEELKFRGNVILFLDGYDEIDETRRANFLKILRILKNQLKTKEIWMSTRPYLRDELGEDCRSLFYSLKPLSEKEQEEFLIKFWCQSNNYQELNVFENKAKKVLKLLTNTINKNYNITGVPLQIRMVAEIFMDTEEIPNVLNYLDLYKKFLDKKYEIFFKEKVKINTDSADASIVVQVLTTMLNNCHENLSILTLFDDEPHICERVTEPDKETIQTAIRLGIINERHGGHYKFVHRTFAEYFASKWIVDNIQNEQVKDFLRRKYYGDDNMHGIRQFIEELILLKANDNVFSYVWMKQYELLDNCLKQSFVTETIVNAKDVLGRTPLHIASYYGDAETINVLLFNKADPNITDDYFNLTAWTTSLKYDKYETLEYLLKYHEDNINEDVKEELCSKKPFSKCNEMIAIEIFKYGQETMALSVFKHDLVEIFKFYYERNHIEENVAYVKECVRCGSIKLLKFMIERSFVNDDCFSLSMLLGDLMYEIKFEIGQYLISEGANVYCAIKHSDFKYHTTFFLRHFLDDKETFCHEMVLSDYFIKHLDENFYELDDMSNFIDSNRNFAKNAILFRAGAYNCWNIVKYLIEKGTYDINTIDDHLNSLLYWAVFWNRYDIVDYLINKGHRIDYVLNSCKLNQLWHERWRWNETYVKVLFYLIMKYNNYTTTNEIKIVHYLPNLEKFDWYIMQNTQLLDEFSETDRIQLTFVSRSEHIPDDLSCDILIIEDASCNLTIQYPYVIRKLTASFFKLSLKNLFRFNNVDKEVLFYAKITDELDIYYKNENLEVLSNDNLINFSAKDCFESTPIHVVTDSWLQYLIDKGININVQDINGNAPLHRSILEKKQKVSVLLVKNGANLNMKNKLGMTVLHCCFKHCSRLIVSETILEKCPDLFVTYDNEGLTPLHLFCMKYFCVPYAFTYESYINETNINLITKNNQDNTPLMLYVKYFKVTHTDFLSVLLGKGANIFQSNVMHTILHETIATGNFEVLNVILSKMKSVNPELLKLHINKEDIYHQTPIMLAIKYLCNRVESILIVLISYGANVNHQNTLGEAPIHCAVKWRNLNALKFLINHHGNQFLKDDGDKTAIDIAKDAMKLYPGSVKLKKIVSYLNR